MIHGPSVGSSYVKGHWKWLLPGSPLRMHVQQYWVCVASAVRVEALAGPLTGPLAGAVTGHWCAGSWGHVLCLCLVVASALSWSGVCHHLFLCRPDLGWGAGVQPHSLTQMCRWLSFLVYF